MSKRALILIVLLLPLITACSTLAIDHIVYSDTWETNSSLYSIYYDSENNTVTSDYSNVLFMEKTNEKFVILNMSDIQISSLSLYNSSKQMTVFKDTADKLMETTEPDLITYTGDFGDYLNTDKSLMKISSVIDSYGIPWAPVLGNHDNAGSVAVKKAKELEEFDNSLFRTGPANLAYLGLLSGKTNIPALGNYIVNIVEKDKETKELKLVYSLIFMNTGNHYVNENNERELSSYSSLSEKQIQWYKWAVKSAQSYNPNVKSALIIHIPIYAYKDALFAASKGNSQSFDYYRTISYEDSFSPDIWNDGYKNSFGVVHEEICCNRHDDHVFEAIKEMGSTNLVLCGHDHVNNTVIEYQGVILAYSMKTGIGSYHESGFNGGTEITITDNSVLVRHIVTDNSQ